MNLPKLPDNFSKGETLSAEKLNALLAWMKAAAEILPQLEISAGPGLLCNRGIAGTSVSLARGFVGSGSNASKTESGTNPNFRRKLFFWSTEKTDDGSENGSEDGGGAKSRTKNSVSKAGIFFF